MSNQPTAEELPRWHRWFAIECNNRAWQLSEAAQRSAAEDDEMLSLAHAAAWHWAAIGTAHNVALAQLLLGQVHALLGQGGLAQKFARASFDFLSSRESEPWELAFAHAVLAHAALAAGDAETHALLHAEARALGEALGKEDREIFDATFRRIPAPADAT